MSLNLREFFKLEDINFSQEELELPYETTKHNEDNKPEERRNMNWKITQEAEEDRLLPC